MVIENSKGKGGLISQSESLVKNEAIELMENNLIVSV